MYILSFDLGSTNIKAIVFTDIIQCEIQAIITKFNILPDIRKPCTVSGKEDCL